MRLSGTLSNCILIELHHIPGDFSVTVLLVTAIQVLESCDEDPLSLVLSREESSFLKGQVFQLIDYHHGPPLDPVPSLSFLSCRV